jgi:hypothetical protein
MNPELFYAVPGPVLAVGAVAVAVAVESQRAFVPASPARAAPRRAAIAPRRARAQH